MSFMDIMKMPVHKLDEYLTWKIKYDSDREKAKADSLGKIKI